MKIDRPTPKQQIPDNAKKVFTGVIFDVYQWEQEMYDGTKTTFEALKRQDTVNVIPITTEGKIIITKQEQPGLKLFIGTPGGRIDLGEDPLTAAKRELGEETGYRSENFILWDAVQPSAMIDWTIYTFIAKNCKQDKDMQLDSGEKIELMFLTFDELVKLICEDNFRDTEIALKMLKAKEKGKLESMRKLFLS